MRTTLAAVFLLIAGAAFADEAPPKVGDVDTFRLLTGHVVENAKIVKFERTRISVETRKGILSIAFNQMLPAQRVRYEAVAVERAEDREARNVASIWLAQDAKRDMAVVQVVSDGVFLGYGRQRYFLPCDSSEMADGQVLRGPFWEIGRYRYPTVSNSFAVCGLLTADYEKAMELYKESAKRERFGR